MKLLTKAIEKRLDETGCTDNLDDKPVICKFFTPDGSFTWYVVEGERMEDGDWTFFGLVDSGPGSEWADLEWGYFTLGQLIEVRGKFGLPVERDLWVSEDLKVNSGGPVSA